MLEALLAGLAGLVIGSFLNVCVFRLPRDLSVVSPRSFCPSCEKTISWHDNVPLLSFALLGGRCRYCHERISWRYPIVELLTGMAFAAAVAILGPSLAALKFSVFSAILIALMATDVEERILPDEFTLGGTTLGLILSLFVALPPGIVGFFLPYGASWRWRSLAEAAFAAGFSSGAIWLIGFLYQKVRRREGLGLGDVKMVAMIGAFLGMQGVLMTLVAGSLLGAVGGSIHIVLTRKDPATYELPFGTFLGVAALGVAVYGTLAMAWYAPGGRGL